MPIATHVDPHSPTHQRHVTVVARAVLAEARSGSARHELPDLAAALTYYSVFSLFPAALAVLGLVGLVVSRADGLSQLLALADQIGGSPFVDQLRPPLEQLASHAGSGLAVVLGTALALWGSLGYVAALSRALNHIWNQREHRGVVQRTAAQLLSTIAIVTMLALTAIALVLGPGLTATVARASGNAGWGSLLWASAQVPLVLVFVLTALWILRSVSAEGSQPWLSWGATLSVGGSVAATGILAWYVRSIAHFQSTYGALGSIIGVLLWLWLVNLLLLLGSEFDHARAVVKRPSFH